MPRAAPPLFEEEVPQPPGSNARVFKTVGAIFHAAFQTGPGAQEVLVAGGGGVAFGKGAPLGFVVPQTQAAKGGALPPHSVTVVTAGTELTEPTDYVSAPVEAGDGSHVIASSGIECASFWRYRRSTVDGVPSGKPELLSAYCDEGSTAGGANADKVQKRKRKPKRVAVAPSGSLAFVSGDSATHRLHIVGLEQRGGSVAAVKLAAIAKTEEIHTVCCAQLVVPAAITGGASNWETGMVLVAAADDLTVEFHVVPDVGPRMSAEAMRSRVRGMHRVRQTLRCVQREANPRNDYFKKYRFNRLFFAPGPARQFHTISTRPEGPTYLTTYDLVWDKATQSGGLSFRMRQRCEAVLPGYTPLPLFKPKTAVCSADLSPEGDVVAYGTSVGTVAVCTLDGQVIGMVPEAHGDDPVLSVAVRRVAPDEFQVVSCCSAGMRMWSLSRKAKRRFPGVAILVLAACMCVSVCVYWWFAAEASPAPPPPGGWLRSTAIKPAAMLRDNAHAQALAGISVAVAAAGLLSLCVSAAWMQTFAGGVLAGAGCSLTYPLVLDIREPAVKTAAVLCATASVARGFWSASANRRQDLKQITVARGKDGALGFAVSEDGTVTKVVRGSPAARAGVSEGAKIRAVDGEAAGSSAFELLKAAGASVRLSVEAPPAARSTVSFGSAVHALLAAALVTFAVSVTLNHTAAAATVDGEPVGVDARLCVWLAASAAHAISTTARAQWNGILAAGALLAACCGAVEAASAFAASADGPAAWGAATSLLLCSTAKTAAADRRYVLTAVALVCGFAAAAADPAAVTLQPF